MTFTRGARSPKPYLLFKIKIRQLNLKLKGRFPLHEADIKQAMKVKAAKTYF